MFTYSTETRRREHQLLCPILRAPGAGGSEGAKKGSCLLFLSGQNLVGTSIFSLEESVCWVPAVAVPWMQCMLNASARSSFALHVLQPTLPSKQRAFEMHRSGCQGARERGGVVNHLLKFRSVLPLLLRFGRPQKMHMVNRDGLIAA